MEAFLLVPLILVEENQELARVSEILTQDESCPAGLPPPYTAEPLTPTAPALGPAGRGGGTGSSNAAVTPRMVQSAKTRTLQGARQSPDLLPKEGQYGVPR